MNILIVQTMETGVYYHRQYIPHYTWLDSGAEFQDDFVVIVEMMHLEKLVDVLSEYRFDIAIFSMRFIIPRNFITMLQFLKKRGTKLVLDIDDYFAGFNEMKKDIKMADALTTTSKNLQDFIYQRGGKNVHIIENGIDSKSEQFEIKPSNESELWFGYLGSTRHEKDLLEMRYDFSEHNLYTVIPDYNEILKVDRHGQLLNYKDYAHCYNNIDVALAPLQDSRFNSCKSILKVIEAGFKKKAIICSDVEPYNRDKSLFPAIDLIPSGVSWKQRVSTYTKEEAIQRGEELFNLVQPYEVRNLNQKRREIYKKIIGR
jgi:hypothetical protein